MSFRFTYLPVVPTDTEPIEGENDTGFDLFEDERDDDWPPIGMNHVILKQSTTLDKINRANINLSLFF